MNFARVAALPLPPRLVLAALPAPIGIWADDWIPDPYWIYLWHPPLMDVLFGLLMLVPFISSARAWPLRVALLVGASCVIHFGAVSAVANSQWLFEFIGDRHWLGVYPIRWLNVLPLALAATLAFAGITAAVAGLRMTRRYWLAAGVAGLVSGVMFYLTMTVHAPWAKGAWNIGLPWQFWRMSICTALYAGSRR